MGDVFSKLPRVDAVFVPGAIRPYAAQSAHAFLEKTNREPPPLSSQSENVDVAAGIQRASG